MNTKIVTQEQIETIARDLQAQQKKIITTNGTFDLLHAGHVRFLEQAKALGDALIVGLNSDTSVKSYKGDKRPINTQEDRAAVLAALACVDHVIIFDEPDPRTLLEKIKPRIHVKASDYTVHTILEKDTVEKNGGRVHILPLLAGRSTTDLIKKIVELYRDQNVYKNCSKEKPHA